jgi:hypothetical protein
MKTEFINMDWTELAEVRVEEWMEHSRHTYRITAGKNLSDNA